MSSRAAEAFLTILAVLGGQATREETEQIVRDTGILQMDDTAFERWKAVLEPFVKIQRRKWLVGAGGSQEPDGTPSL